MIKLSDINISYDELSAATKQADLIEEQQADSLDFAQQEQARIDAYFSHNRRMLRWGFPQLVTKPERIKTANELMTCLKDYSLSGSGQLSDNFLIGAYYLLEANLQSCMVKVNGMIRTNLDKLRQELKFLKSRLKVLKSLLESIDDNLSVEFIDKRLKYKFIVSELIKGLIEIINRGFRFKHTKRYVSLASEGIAGNYSNETYRDKSGEIGFTLKGNSNMKATGIYKQATPKVYKRNIRRLFTMPVLRYNENGDIVSYTKYKRKELPFYLQD